MKLTACFFLTLVFVGRDQITPLRKEQSGAEQSSPAQTQVASTNGEKRFAFPAKSSPFPESSVALDTTTGRLCKTYEWEDNPRLPRGLLLCSEISAMSSSPALKGAKKAYRGFTYTFNGATWVKGNKAQRYNEKTQEMEPWSEDQYDPLNLFSKEEKAKTTLTPQQIRKVADQFGVSYEEAAEEAKQQGYNVLARPPLESFDHRNKPDSKYSGPTF